MRKSQRVHMRLPCPLVGEPAPKGLKGGRFRISAIAYSAAIFEGRTNRREHSAIVSLARAIGLVQ